MIQRPERLRMMERRLLKLYSDWHESHRIELADAWLKLAGELVRLKPNYSFRKTLQRAF